MTLFNLSVSIKLDANPVVNSSTFSDLQSVIDLNVCISTSFAVTSTSQRLNVDVGNFRLIAVIEINGISYIKNFDKA